MKVDKCRCDMWCKRDQKAHQRTAAKNKTKTAHSIHYLYNSSKKLSINVRHGGLLWHSESLNSNLILTCACCMVDAGPCQNTACWTPMSCPIEAICDRLAPRAYSIFKVTIKWNCTDRTCYTFTNSCSKCYVIDRYVTLIINSTNAFKDDLQELSLTSASFSRPELHLRVI